MANLLYPKSLYFLVLSMFIFGSTTFGQNPDSLQNVKRISITVKNEQVNKILDSLRIKSGIWFTGGFDPKKTMSLNLRDVRLITVLQIMHDSVGLTWQTGGNDIRISMDPHFKKDRSAILKISQPALPAYKTGGIIRDENGKPLYGVTIIISGTKLGTKTDLFGRFKLGIDTYPQQLEISYIGYEKQLLRLMADTVVDISLKSASKDVKEIMVMAYYEGDKRNTAGTATKILLHETGEALNSNGLLKLQGQVPGATVTPTTGLPGAAVEMQIRGSNSFLGSSNPLYIIAGVPSVMTSKTVNSLPSIAAQSINGGISPFSSLILDGIESVSILKDADATSIYGSRAANGVFLFSPFKVKPGPAKIEVNLLHAVGAPAHKLDLLKPKQYREIRREALGNDKASAGVDLETKENAPDLTLWDSLKNTDWQHELIGKPVSINNVVVAVTAGDTRMQGRIAASYYRESTPFLNKLFYNRKGISASFNYQSVNNIFKLETFSSLSTDENKLYVGNLKGLFTPYNAPGPLDNKKQPVWTPGLDNPIAQLMREYRIAMWNGTVSIIPKVRLFKSLHLKAILGANGLFTNETSKIPKASQNPLGSETISGEASQARKRMSGYIAEPIIEFVPLSIPGDFTLIAGASLQHRSNAGNGVTGKGYSDDRYLQKWDSAAVLSYSIPEWSSYKYGAVFGMLKYIWKAKYITNISFRKDASSKFSHGNNVGNFWSVAEAWIFSEERSVKQALPFMNFGKLKGSIGLTGIDQVGDYQFDDIWSPTPNDNLYEGIGGIGQDNPRNTNFTWEKSLKMETAVNLEFLDGRIKSDFSYFRNRNSRQLIEYRMPGQTGYQNMIRNGSAKVLTAGLEISLYIQIFNHKNAGLSIGTNLNFQKNKLLVFDNLKQSSYYGKLLLNEPTTVINKLKSEGVRSDSGFYKFTDVDKNGKLDVEDYQNLGTTMPKLFGGVEISSRYGRWELRATADFKKQMGPAFLQAALLADLYPGTMANMPTEILNRWQKKGDMKDYPKLSSMKDGDVWSKKPQMLASGEAYTSTSFFKLRELYVCYNISKKWLSRYGMEDAKLYFKGCNLLTFTKYKTGDPEISNILSLSTLRMFALGAKITLAANNKKQQK